MRGVRLGATIGNIWKVGRLLGSGCHGDVYEVTDNYGRKAVVKTIDPQDGSLVSEAGVLQKMHGFEGFPEVYYYGRHRKWEVIVMEKLSKSLEDVKSERGVVLSTRDVLICGIQILYRLEDLHDKGFVHGDLHSGNIMFGGGMSNEAVIYLIDFGGAKCYKDSMNRHNERKRTTGSACTVSYGSASMLDGYTACRRDDLESLVYILVDLHKGRLPWTVNRQWWKTFKFKDVIRMKKDLEPSAICKDTPSALKTMLLRVRGMEFSERPDYPGLRQLMRDGLALHNFSEDGKFDWQ